MQPRRLDSYLQGVDRKRAIAIFSPVPAGQHPGGAPAAPAGRYAVSASAGVQRDKPCEANAAPTVKPVQDLLKFLSSADYNHSPLPPAAAARAAASERDRNWQAAKARVAAHKAPQPPLLPSF